MINRQTLGIWAVLAMCAVSCAPGGGEQWLNYYSSRNAGEFIEGASSQHIELTAEKPDGVEMPEFKGEPLFGKFKTPMVKDGYLWLAFDRSSKRGIYSILYVDSNANKSLKDEKAVSAYMKEQYYSQFGPVPVVFESEDGPITYHFNLSLNCYRKERHAYVSSGGWYAGQVSVDGTKYECMLIDYDCDGTFNDKSENSRSADRIQIKYDKGWKSAFVGKYLAIDDKLYNLQVAQDGAYVKISKAVDVNYGNFRVPLEIAEIQAGGKNGSFVFYPEKGICKIPAGKYKILKWTVEEKTGGDVWKMQARGGDDKSRFIVTETNEPNLMIGQPVISKLTVHLNGKNHNINHRLEGRLGESITILRNNSQVKAPKLTITNADKSYNKTFSLEYG